MLSFFPRGVLDEILNLIESVSEDFPSYSFSFVRAAVACSILKRTSGFRPSSETTSPRYMKLVTVPNFILPICLYFSLDAIGAVCHQFDVLGPDLSYLVQVSSRLSTRASSSCSFSARASMSSANRRLVIFLPPMITFLSCSSRAPDMIPSRKMLLKAAKDIYMKLGTKRN